MPKRLGFAGAVPVDKYQIEETFGEVFHLPPTAAGTDYTMPLGYMKGSIIQNILAVYLTLATAINKSTSNYVTIALVDETTSQTIATINTNAASGSLAANARISLTIDYTKAISQGDLLSLVVTHGGSGAAISGALLEVHHRQ